MMLIIMHPILLKLGPLTLYSYGLLVALGFLAGLTVADKEAKRFSWDRDWINKLVVFDFLIGLLGARITYVITRLGEENFFTSLFDIHSGFVFYGGLIASWLYLYISVRKKKISLWSVLDVFAMAICIGEGVGRFGCLLGGCCYGTPTTLPFGVIMHAEKHLGPLHPVQAYEGIALILFFLALWLRRTHKKYNGEAVVWFVGYYSIIRFILEYYRGDSIRGFVIDNILSTSQFISILIFAFTIFLHLKLIKNENKNSH